jgi:hypothetical protein
MATQHRISDISRLRRLLVSPEGVAHAPNCRKVKANAEIRAWGELNDVPTALRDLAARAAVPSLRSGRLTPGPTATAACRWCLG